MHHIYRENPESLRRSCRVAVSTRLETRRLIVPTFEPQDAEAWLAMFADPEVRRFVPGASPDDAGLPRCLRGPARDGT
jgi:RimJ/RimL family protein N-acetyltransferase